MLCKQRLTQAFYLLLCLPLVNACEQTDQNKRNNLTLKPQTIELVFPTNSQKSTIEHSIIWLHGLGATANDFPPIVPHLGLDDSRPIRFIFPQAPDRPITINGGYVMPGWYDIKGLDLASKEDREGLEISRNTVEKLIDGQIEQGVPSENIILAGFSQGGAVTYYTGTRTPRKLAGLLTLSTYLVFLEKTEEEQSNKNKDTPIFASHGTQDPVVHVELGELSVKSLKDLGYPVEWQTYPMQHEVSMPQIQAIGSWINKVFGSEK